jgi:hypothetical protein
LSDDFEERTPRARSSERARTVVATLTPASAAILVTDGLMSG